MAHPGKKIKRITDIGTVIQTIFADLAGIIRTSESGMDLEPIGALNNAVRVGENTPVVVYNGGAAVAYVTFGDQSVAAPASPTDGIPVAVGEKYVVNSGPHAWIRASAATMYGYKADSGL